MKKELEPYKKAKIRKQKLSPEDKKVTKETPFSFKGQYQLDVCKSETSILILNI